MAQENKTKIKIIGSDYTGWEEAKVYIAAQDSDVQIGSDYINSNGSKAQKASEKKEPTYENLPEDGPEKTAIKSFLKKYCEIDNSGICSCTYEGKKNDETNEETKKKPLSKIKKININGKEEEKGKFDSIVGVIRDRNYECMGAVYDIELIVQSRMDGAHPFLLYSMLQAAGMDLKGSGLSDPGSMEELFEFLLVYWYMNQLTETYRLGAFRTYQRFQRNDEKVRGTIDISRHIRLNMGLNNGKIAYSYRERTADNAFNHLLIRTYRELERNFPDHVRKVNEKKSEIKKIIQELCILAPSYHKESIQTIMRKNQQRIHQPYYQPYEKLRQTCFRVLRHMGFSVFSGEEEDVEGILFYVPDLWELYVKEKMDTWLEEINKEINKEINEESDIKVELEFQETIEIWGPKKQKTGDNQDSESGKENPYKQFTYPDFILKSNKEPFMILDAKYRPGWEKPMKGGKLGRDFLGDYDKCIRDMNSIGAHATGVVFPYDPNKEEDEEKDKDKGKAKDKAEDNEIIEHYISQYNKIDRFFTFPFRIPESTDKEKYETWMEDTNKMMDRSKEDVKKYVKAERDYFNKTETLRKALETERENLEKKSKERD